MCATLYAARLILLIFVFAILFAYLIDRLSDSCSAIPFIRGSKKTAVVEVYLVFLLLIAFAGQAFAPSS